MLKHQKTDPFWDSFLEIGLFQGVEGTRLDRSFFEAPTVKVAQKLLGKVLVWGAYQGLITETEAYVGQEDPACHAARGKTKRTAMMFGPAGYTYVYLIYGMYYCLNIVTEAEGFPAAVLIRGSFLTHPDREYVDGPGKLCRQLGIHRQHHGEDLITSPTYFLKDIGVVPPFQATPRVGISQGTELLWRFIVESSPQKRYKKGSK